MLWGRRERSRRGPKPALTVERIVEAAVEIADAEGLGPLSMSRLAQSLGFTPMSLYRYVRNKDELLLLMSDAGGGPLLPPDASATQDWREGLHRLASGLFAVYRQHPWMLDVPLNGMPPVGPNALLWLDEGLRCLANTPLSPEERINVMTHLMVHVRGEALFIQQYLGAGGSGSGGQRADGDVADGPLPSYGDLLRLVIDADRYPALTDVVATGILDGLDADQADFDTELEVEFGLSLMLDGIAVLIERAGRAASAGPASGNLAAQ